MRKINWVATFLVLIILTTGVFFLINNGIKSDMSDDTNNDDQKSTIYYSSASQMTAIESIDDLVKYSDLVIIGTVLSSEEIDDMQLKHTVSMDKCLKGNVDSTDIDVYEVKNKLQSDKQYILFLGCFDSTLYPRAVYTSIDKDNIFEISNGKIKTNSENAISKKEEHADNIIKSIENSLYLKSQTTKIVKKAKESDSTKNLIESSDYVVKVSINKVVNINKYVSLINVNIIEQYKGDLGKRDEFYVPTGLTTENEYLLFFQETEDGSINLTSRKGSIISKDNLNNWNNAINLFTN